MIEILGRLIHFLPSRPSDAYVQLTRAVGPVQEPEIHYAHTSEGEFNLLLDSNAMGFRDPDTQFPAEPGKQRILVLGDSYTAAWQVPTAQRWTEQIERLRPDWALLNLGMPNWGTDQEYLTLANYPFTQQPDIVLMMIFPANDVHDNALLLLTGFPPSRPYFVPAANPVLDTTSLKLVPWNYENPFDQPAKLQFPANVKAWLRLNSVLYRAATNLKVGSPAPQVSASTQDANSQAAKLWNVFKTQPA
jgi:hypothetical protein